MNYLLTGIVFLAGACIPVQFAANKRLEDSLHSSALAVAIAFAIGAIVTLALAMTGLFGKGTLSGAAGAPWWTWIGGAISVAVVLASVIALPKAGAEAVIAATVVGQLVSGAVLDHFGWLGVPKIPFNLWRALGTALLIGGALIMQKK